MIDDKKKLAAISSAVMRYIQQEEEVLALKQLNALNGMPNVARPQGPLNAWGMSGRQAQMQTRNLMQMKALYR